MPVQLIATGLLSLRNFVVFISPRLLFLLFGLLIVIIFCLFLRSCDYFPFLLQRAFTYQFIFCVGQVNPDLATIEDVVSASSANVCPTVPSGIRASSTTSFLCHDGPSVARSRVCGSRCRLRLILRRFRRCLSRIFF